MLGRGTPSQLTVYGVWWLLGITVVTLLLFYFRKRLGRAAGASLIALYLGYVVVVLLYG